jgi:hypothetical protein
MSGDQDNWEKEWAGLEPRQRRSGSWGCWLGVILLSLVLLAACTAGAYLVWQRLDLPQPVQLLTPPTAVSSAASTLEAEILSSPDPLLLAPTVTLPANPAAGNIEAAQLSFIPVIDGELQEWNELPIYASEHRVYNVAGWDGTDDITAHWRLGWDVTNLYVAVAVEDDRHVQTQTGNQIFNGDSVSLQIDTIREGDFGPGLNRDDFQINLSPGDFAGILPSAFRFRGTNEGTAGDAPGHDIAVAARQVGEGYTLEAAIPWRDLDLNPRPGLVIGLALNVNDNDTPGTAVQEVMKSNVATRTFRDPSSWGALTLR